MGLVRSELTLMIRSSLTLGVGIGLGLICAIAAAWIMPLDQLTPEMQRRISPTLLDLGVASISGIAGAYAHAKEEIAKSLAGVAIAVALVPPLSVAGVGVGWGDWAVAYGALLLFVTNLFGIALAASLTFLVLGFAPFKTARPGLFITLALVVFVSFSLYSAFQDLVEREKIFQQIPAGGLVLAGQPVKLRVIAVRGDTPHVVRVELNSTHRLDERHVDALKRLIDLRVESPVELEAQLILRR